MMRQAARGELNRYKPPSRPVAVKRATIAPNENSWGEQYKKMLAETGAAHTPLPKGAPNRYLESAPEPREKPLFGKFFQAGGGAFVGQVALLSVVVVSALFSKGS